LNITASFSIHRLLLRIPNTRLNHILIIKKIVNLIFINFVFICREWNMYKLNEWFIWSFLAFCYYWSCWIATSCYEIFNYFVLLGLVILN
jgi:hypothetical protein